MENSLQALGFAGVKGVRVGKYLELFLEAETREEAASRLKDMAERLLSNPVIEDYNYSLQEVEL